RAEWKGVDSDRPLTKEGIKKMKKVAQGMRHAKLSFDWILTSPYRRAYDTAEIVVKEFKAKNTLRVVRTLRSEGDPKSLIRYIAATYHSWNTLLLVGHEPHLSQLIGTLIGAQEGIALDLKKGGLAKLNVRSLRYGKCASLEALLPPKFLKKLA